MLLLKKADFNDRDNLGEYLNSLNLKGIGVEVGTHQADYAEKLLDKWEGERLFCVDPWESLPGYESQEKTLSNSVNRETDRKLALERLERFGSRKRLIQKVSLEAVTLFKDESLDFVYIDGDHSFEAVQDDLEAWADKVKVGGIIAGHDIICPGEPDNANWGLSIQPAVINFAYKYNLTVQLIVETLSLPWSFLMVKQWDSTENKQEKLS